MDLPANYPCKLPCAIYTSFHYTVYYYGILYHTLCYNINTKNILYIYIYIYIYIYEEEIPLLLPKRIITTLYRDQILHVATTMESYSGVYRPRTQSKLSYWITGAEDPLVHQFSSVWQGQEMRENTPAITLWQCCNLCGGNCREQRTGVASSSVTSL